MLRIYYSHPMTSRRTDVVLFESSTAALLSDLVGGIDLIDPVVIEKIRPTRSEIAATQSQLRDEFWKRDKREVWAADVVITDEGDIYSHGCIHEFGLSRYLAWNPTIRIFKTLGPSVTHIEGDYVAPNLLSALVFAKGRFGSRWQRILWRLKIVPFGILKNALRQMWKFFR